MKPDAKSVAVVGAGIAGLVCAYELQKAGVVTVVFEKNDHVGGRMASRSKDHLPFDLGANFLVNNYQATLAYCRELGIGDTCRPMTVGTSCEFRQNHLFETTSQPLKLLLKNQHLSFMARLRMAYWFLKESLTHRHLDFYNLSNSIQFDTDNAYDYAIRHAGQDVADYIVNAFVSAYQFHGAKEISLAMMLALLELMITQNDGFTMCHTVGGMAKLPEAFAKKLDVRLNFPVEKVFAGTDQAILNSEQNSFQFDVIVMATTANITSLVYQNPTQQQRDLLASVKYASTINLSFLVPKVALKNLGLVMVPITESVIISEYTDESMKGSELIKDGKTLVNVGLHDDYAKKIMRDSDVDVFALVKKELLRVCPLLQSCPDQVDNYDLERWPAAMPKYYPGFLTSVNKFLTHGQGDNHIFFCGDYLNSPWIEGSIRCGQRVAKRVLTALQ